MDFTAVFSIPTDPFELVVIYVLNATSKEQAWEHAQSKALEVWCDAYGDDGADLATGVLFEGRCVYTDQNHGVLNHTLDLL